MKVLWQFVIIFIVVIATYIGCFNDIDKEKQDKLLNNNVFIRGEVASIKTSHNHAFGIILLKLDSTNIRQFVDTLRTGIYPYKIKAGRAEVYTHVPDGILIGDKVTLTSNSKSLVYYYVKSKQRFEGTISVITYSDDVDYVKQNSVLQ